MKIIKILIVFIVIAGVVFLASQWSSIIHRGDSPIDSEYIDVDKRCSSVRKAWNKESDWNSALLNKQLEEHYQDKSLNLYEYADDAETVENTIREQSTNKLYEAIMREFHSKDCKDKIVEQNYEGVKTLVEKFNMSKDERLQEVEKVKLVYDNITAFINSKHTITAKFNSEQDSWTSFIAACNYVINKAAGYRNDPIYIKDLDNIQRFQDGLNDSFIRGVVNKQEDAFYKSLSDQIIDYYNRLSQDENNIIRENVDRFYNVLSKYSDETELYVSNVMNEYESFEGKYKDIRRKNEDTIAY